MPIEESFEENRNAYHFLNDLVDFVEGGSAMPLYYVSDLTLGDLDSESEPTSWVIPEADRLSVEERSQLEAIAPIYDPTNEEGSLASPYRFEGDATGSAFVDQDGNVIVVASRKSMDKGTQEITVQFDGLSEDGTFEATGVFDTDQSYDIEISDGSGTLTFDLEQWQTRAFRTNLPMPKDDLSGKDPSNGMDYTADLPQAPQAPAIDGSADASWQDASAYTAEHAVNGSFSSSDLSLTWRGQWDAEGIYLWANVTDDMLASDSGDNWWEDDTIELYLDPGNDKARSYRAGDAQYGFRYGDGTVHLGSSGSGVTTDGVEMATAETDAGYVVEAKVPWSALGMSEAPPQGGDMLGMDVAVNDDDDGDGRDAILAWAFEAGDQAFNDPSVLGTATLLEPIPSDAAELPQAPQTLAIDGSADASWQSAPDYVAENVLRERGCCPAPGMTWRAQWDTEGVYLWANVADDNELITDNSSDLWFRDDAVELFLDVGNDKADSYGPGDAYYGFRYGDDAVHLRRSGSGVSTDGVEVATAETDSGWVAEVKVPWSALGVSEAPSQGNVLGMDVHARDDKAGGGYDSEISWADSTGDGEGDHGHGDPAVFGTAVLAEEGAGGSVPDELTVAARNTTVNAAEGTFLLPVDVSGLAAAGDTTVHSYQFKLDYDATVVEATGVVVEGTASAKAATEQNIDSEAGTVQFAAADEDDSDGLLTPAPTEERPLVFVEMRVLEGVSSGQASEVIFSEFLFNEGAPEVGTMAGTIEIGEVPYGDVSDDGQVTALDASMVLQAVVDLTGLTSEEQIIADVSGNSMVTAFDAALILDFVSGEIETFPVERSQEQQQQALAAAQQEPQGEPFALRWGEVQTPNEEGSSGGGGGGAAASAVRLVPLHLEGTAAGPVRSVEVVGDLGAKGVSVENVELAERLSEEWVLSYNTTERGQLRVAVAGPEALPKGKVLTARLRLSSDVLEGRRQAGGGAEAGPSLRGRARLNEAPMQTLPEVSLVQLPTEFALSGNAPNPFRTRTEIRVDLPEAAEVTVHVYDALGRRIKTVQQSMGAGQGRTVPIEAGALASGVYLYRVTADTEGGQRHNDTGRMVVVK